MKTIVITDSSGVAPPAPDVRVVPITVLFPDAEVADDRVSAARVLASLRRHEGVMKTRAPSVLDYIEAIEPGEADAAVVITPAAELTAMWRNACNAVYLSERPAAVVDSRTAATGQALVVEAAARCAAQGGTLADVVSAAEDAAHRVRLVATVASVEPIAASGILPSAPLEHVQATGEHALFRMRDGAVEVVRLVAPDADVVAELAALWRIEGGPQAAAPVVFTTRDDDVASSLRPLVGSDRVHRPSAAMTVYTGGGVLGVAWLARDDGQGAR